MTQSQSVYQTWVKELRSSYSENCISAFWFSSGKSNRICIWDDSSCTNFLSPTLQAVIQNPFSNGGSPGGETVGGETRFAYFPAATVSDGTATAVSVQATADPTITQAGGEKHFFNRQIKQARVVDLTPRGVSSNPGQFYVMMSPPEVLQTATQRTIAPRTHTYTAWVQLKASSHIDATSQKISEWPNHHNPSAHLFGRHLTFYLPICTGLGVLCLLLSFLAWSVLSLCVKQ